jgi:hypothetical protein
MAQGQQFPFTLIVSDPLANSFVGPVPQDAVALALQAEREGSNECYNTYVDHGMVLEEYERTMDQNEVLGLNDMKTENYMEDATTTSDAQQDSQGHAAAAAASDEQATKDKVKAPYYGTDQPEEVPDRIRRVDIRGPDHPHSVGKAPVEGDTTVMGAGSLNFAVPSIAQRGTKVVAISSSSSSLQSEQVQSTTGTTDVSDDGSQLLRKLIHDFEYNDNSFRMNDAYEGSIEGMVYKDGAQGLGYYTNVSLLQLHEEYKRVHNNS